MAKYQMDNLVQLIDTVLNRTGLTMSRVAAVPRQNMSQDLLTVSIRAKHLHLKSAADVLRKGAKSIRAGADVTRILAHDLQNVNRFWQINQMANKRMAIDISIHSSKPSLIPLIQVPDGHLAIQGIPNSNLFSELASRFHTGMYRLIFDTISASPLSKTLKVHRLADRIVWKGPDGPIELHPNSEVTGTPFAEAISARLLSDFIAERRKASLIADNSHAQSLNFPQIMHFVEHEHLCQGLTNLFSRLSASYRSLISIRELHSDSLLHSGWTIYLRKSFLAEIVIERCEISVQCRDQGRQLAYQARCYNTALVDLVITQAIERYQL
jgi:hypothetical protein